MQFIWMPLIFVRKLRTLVKTSEHTVPNWSGMKLRKSLVSKSISQSLEHGIKNRLVQQLKTELSKRCVATLNLRRTFLKLCNILKNMHLFNLKSLSYSILSWFNFYETFSFIGFYCIAANCLWVSKENLFLLESL